jgi:hypothetical protein
VVDIWVYHDAIWPLTDHKPSLHKPSLTIVPQFHSISSNKLGWLFFFSAGFFSLRGALAMPLSTL